MPLDRYREGRHQSPFCVKTQARGAFANWTRRRLQSEYALPLMLEAVLMLCFGLLGSRMAGQAWLFIPRTLTLLCFMMGLQNAIATKLSCAEIRTTHVTGIVTDLGIELGKLAY